MFHEDVYIFLTFEACRPPAGPADPPFRAASDYMAEKIPGAQKVVVPAAGHAVNIDQPQAFIDAVLPFLDGLDSKAARAS